MDEAFFTVHRDIPREGPGAPEDVAWALDRLGIDGAARVLDAACGPGADLVTLAHLLPQAQITGIDKVAQFVRAARTRVSAYAPRVTTRQGDMARIEGPYDLIWCAGALYFLGVTEGLQTWRRALAPGGAVAFSEPVLLGGHEPQAVRDFWAEYPDITDAEGIFDQVRAADYSVIDSRVIVGAPWRAYYEPLKARIAMLRPDADAALTEALDDNAREIARWEAAPERIAYLLVLARPQ